MKFVTQVHLMASWHHYWHHYQQCHWT